MIESHPGHQCFCLRNLFQRTPYRILEAWRDEKIRLVASIEILEEYRRVGKILAEDHPGINLLPWVELVIQKAEIFSADDFA